MVYSRFFNKFRKKDINNQLYNDYSIKNDSNVRFDKDTVTPPRVVYSKFGSPPYLNSNTDFVSKFKSLGNWQKEIPLPKTKPVFDKISLDMQEEQQAPEKTWFGKLKDYTQDTHSQFFPEPKQKLENPNKIKADEFRRNKLLQDGFTSFQKNRNLNLENAKKINEAVQRIENEKKFSPEYAESRELDRKFRENKKRENEENAAKSKARDFSYLTRNAAYKYSQNNLREPFQRWKEQVRQEKEAEQQARDVRLGQLDRGSNLLGGIIGKRTAAKEFQRWKEQVRQEKEAEQQARDVRLGQVDRGSELLGGIADKRTVAKEFQRWKEQVRQEKEAEQQARDVRLGQVDRGSELLKRFTDKQDKVSVSDAFQRWKEQVRQEKEAEEKLDRINEASLLLDKFSNKYNKEGLLEAFRKLKENAAQQRPLRIEAAVEQNKNNLTDEYKQNINKTYNKYKSGSSMFKFNPVSPRTNLINLQQKAEPLINKLESQQARDRAYSPSNAGLSWDKFNTKLQDDWNRTLAELNEVTDDTQNKMTDADEFGYTPEELDIIKPPAQNLIDRFNELQRQGIPAGTKTEKWKADVEQMKDFVNSFEKAYNDNNRVLFNKYKKQAVDITNNIMAFTESLKAIDGITPNEKRELYGYAKKTEELYKKELAQQHEEEKKMEPQMPRPFDQHSQARNLQIKEALNKIRETERQRFKILPKVRNVTYSYQYNPDIAEHAKAYQNSVATAESLKDELGIDLSSLKELIQEQFLQEFNLADIIENYGYNVNEVTSPIAKGKTVIDQFNNFTDEGISRFVFTKNDEWKNVSEEAVDLYHEMKDAFEDGDKIKFQNIKNQLIPLAEKVTIFVRKLTKDDNVPASERTSTLNILKKAQELWQKEVPIVLPNSQPNNLENQITALKTQRPKDNKDAITRDQHVRSGLPVPADVQQRLDKLMALNQKIAELEKKQLQQSIQQPVAQQMQQPVISEINQSQRNALYRHVIKLNNTGDREPYLRYIAGRLQGDNNPIELQLWNLYKNQIEK